MERAFLAELYELYAPAVSRRARVLLGDPDAARDALQEVFLRVLKNGTDFRGESSPMTWLYSITTNYCLNVIRNRAKRRVLLATFGKELAPGQCAAVDARLAFHDVLYRIPEDLRTIAVYYYLDEMNHEEIAAIVGVSRRTVGNQLARLRDLLRQDEILVPKEVSA